jgi:hypothetical protein
VTGIVTFRCVADEGAVTGGEGTFTVPVLLELGPRGLLDRGHD